MLHDLVSMCLSRLYRPSLEHGALPGSAMHGSTGTAWAWLGLHGFTDKKENQIFLIYKEIQNGAVAKSYTWNKEGNMERTWIQTVTLS
jgi:hypothetical protein